VTREEKDIYKEKTRKSIRGEVFRGHTARKEIGGGSVKASSRRIVLGHAVRVSKAEEHREEARKDRIAIRGNGSGQGLDVERYATIVHLSLEWGKRPNHAEYCRRPSQGRQKPCYA